MDFPGGEFLRIFRFTQRVNKKNHGKLLILNILPLLKLNFSRTQDVLIENSGAKHMSEKTPDFPILVVDDEDYARLGLCTTLRSNGISNLLECGKSPSTLNLMNKHRPGIVLLDLRMPIKSGEELIEEIHREHPDTEIIIVSGKDDVDSVVECMKKGASDYLLKPVNKNRLLSCVRRAIQMIELRRENLQIKEQFLGGKLKNPEAFAEIITRNPKMLALFNYCEAIIPSNQEVVITGETGTGKELFANVIHRLGSGKGKFIPVNLAGLDSNMFSDTLFGHVKGAFTGAESIRKGLIEEAARGTLFLDEIGDLSLEGQIKLLRLLEEREYSPLGSDQLKHSKTRIIVASNKDLALMVSSGGFRKDLFFRMQTHQITIPPLRERLDDLPLLVNHFIELASKELGKKPPSYPPELIILLKNHYFPGNVRELRSMVYDAISEHKSGMLSLNKFKDRILTARGGSEPNNETSVNEIIFPAELPTLKQCAETLVNEAMKRSDGNQSIAARFLGISQQALSKRLKNQGIPLD